MTIHHSMRMAAVLALAAAGAPAPAQQVMKPGVWDLKTTLSIQLGNEKPVAVDDSDRLCLTADFLAEEPYFSLQDDASSEKDGETCETVSKRLQNNRLEWVQNCRGADGEKSVYQIKSHASATALQYAFTDTTQHPKDGRSKSTLKIVGRFVTETCPPDMPRNSSDDAD